MYRNGRSPADVKCTPAQNCTMCSSADYAVSSHAHSLRPSFIGTRMLWNIYAPLQSSIGNRERMLSIDTDRRRGMYGMIVGNG